MGTPAPAPPPTQNQTKVMLAFLCSLLVIFAIWPAISHFFVNNDCKEQNDCESHSNYWNHLFSWFPRLFDGALAPHPPCIRIDTEETCDDLTEPSLGCPVPSTVSSKDPNAPAEEDFLTCTEAKENFYVDSRGFSVPLTDCSAVNKYIKVSGSEGNDNECEDCPEIANLKTGIKTTCNPKDDTPEGEPGPTVVKALQPRPSNGSYCNDGFKLVRTDGESDKCEVCDDIENTISGSTICRDPIESELSTGSTIKKIKTGENFGCSTDGTIKYTRLTGGADESDSCVECGSVNLSGSNHREITGTPPLFSKLGSLTDGFTTNNENFYFEVSGSGLPIDINDKAFSNCSDGNPCDNLLCSGVDKENNKWVSHYMEEDPSNRNKYICKPCNMANVNSSFKSGRNSDGSAPLIVGTEEQCRTGVGTVFYDETFHFMDEQSKQTAIEGSCRTQSGAWTDSESPVNELLTISDDVSASDFCTGATFTDIVKIVGDTEYILKSC